MDDTTKEKTISHFTHPGHVLSPVDDQFTEYACDLCKIPGNNKLRFKCKTCPDFNLDQVCATCKPTTTSFMHPDHTMVLVLSPELTTTKTLCSVCTQDIKGGHYSCCDFHAHPVCTKFPEIVQAGMFPAHPDHALKGIFSSDLTTCLVCRFDCGGLRYRCEEESCDVDFHPACLAAGFDELTVNDDGESNTRGFGKYFRTFMGVFNILSIFGTALEYI